MAIDLSQAISLKGKTPGQSYCSNRKLKIEGQISSNNWDQRRPNFNTGWPWWGSNSTERKSKRNTDKDQNIGGKENSSGVYKEIFLFGISYNTHFRTERNKNISI